MSEQELALALEQLRGAVAQNRTASDMGFSQLAQQITGLTRTWKEQDNRCRTCEASLRAEISVSEQRGLDRLAALTTRIDQGLLRVDNRLRSLEVSRGWLTGLIGLGGALIGALLPIAIGWIKG